MHVQAWFSRPAQLRAVQGLVQPAESMWATSLAMSGVRSHSPNATLEQIHTVIWPHETGRHAVCRAPGGGTASTEHVGNFTRLVRGQAPQPGAYHNVLRMRRWLVSLDSTYGVKGWEVNLHALHGAVVLC